MKAIVCEMCGSQDLVKQDGYYVCQNCGTKYDPEEAKKLMVEVSGAVKVDNSEKLKNYYQLARRAMEENNPAEAEKYYNLLKEEYPNDWEAHFYSNVCKAMQCRVYEITDAFNSLSNTFNSVLRNVKNTVPQTLQHDVVGQILATIINLADSTQQMGRNLYNSNRTQNLENYQKILLASSSLSESFGDSVDNVFGYEMKNVSTAAWADSIKIIGNICNTQFSGNIPANYKQAMNGIARKIQKYDSNYSLPSDTSFVTHDKGNSGGCYVATAVYGSYDCPQVWTLRRYRDYTLAETWYGRAFIRTYYAISPTLVKWFGETEWFKNLWKPTLDRMVRQLNAEGVANTPYQDRNW